MAVKTIAQKLEQLYKLQTIDTKLDQLRAVRGELPMEVSDLEDELVGLNTRLANFSTEIETFNESFIGKSEGAINDKTTKELKARAEQAEAKLKELKEAKENLDKLGNYALLYIPKPDLHLPNTAIIYSKAVRVDTR